MLSDILQHLLLIIHQLFHHLLPHLLEVHLDLLHQLVQREAPLHYHLFEPGDGDGLSDGVIVENRALLVRADPCVVIEAFVGGTHGDVLSLVYVTNLGH